LLQIAGTADPLPAKIGQCSNTTIKDIGTRLENAPGSGDAVGYANGGAQISYDTIKGLKGSRAGDPARLCLISLPQDCPPGDDRGKKYRATNLRTHSSWEAFDSEHMCGGA
jgi:hypothetical protein